MEETGMIKLKDILIESKYIGSCVDVGGNSAEICRIFPDASSMANKVGNPDEDDWGDSSELSEMDFYKYIPKNKIPAKSLKGKVSFHYISVDSFGRTLQPSQSGLFFIYNWDKDIHYFFKR
jgi:hypothetical protein